MSKLSSSRKTTGVPCGGWAGRGQLEAGRPVERLRL